MNRDSSSCEQSKLDFLDICAITQSYEHTLTINRIIFNMVGDLAMASVLSRLLYWFSPSQKTGQQRAKIRKNGKVWVAKKDSDWLEEACVTGKQIKRIKSQLEKMELIETEIHRFDGLTYTHWSLNLEKFVVLYNQELTKIKNNIALCTKGPKQIVPKGQSGLAQRDNPLTSILEQAHTTSYLRHMPAEAGGASSNIEVDAFLNALEGSPLHLFQRFDSQDEKACFKLCEAAKRFGQEFNKVTAVQLVSIHGHEKVMDAIKVFEYRLKRGDTIKSVPATLTSLCRNANLKGQLNVFLNKEFLSDIMGKKWIPNLELYKNFLKIENSEIDFCIDCSYFKTRLKQLFERSKIDINVEE